ncbi:MAG: hypothetical protein ACRCSN_02660 [Dermatophilaceae bacterium]
MGDASAAGEQLWDLPAIDRVAAQVDDRAGDLTQVLALLEGLKMPKQDGAGGAVAAAFAEFVDAAVASLGDRSTRLQGLADDVRRGSLATETTDVANGLGVLSVFREALSPGSEQNADPWGSPWEQTLPGWATAEPSPER